MTRRARVVEAGVLLLASTLLYGILLHGPLVYDDELYAAGDRVFSWGALVSRRYFALTGERSFQPLLTAMQQAAGGGVDVLRAFGIALHALNGVLVAALGRAAGLHPSAAFAAAALFVLFPPSTEAVAVASFHGHLLICFATLAALLAWRRGRPGLSLAALGLGLLSKESAVMIGPLVLLCELFFPSSRPARARRALALLAAVTAAYLIYRFAVLLPAPSFQRPPPASPLGTLGWYFKTLAAAGPLCLERGSDAASIPAFLLWAAGGAYLFARGRALALWLWPAFALLPVLHLIPFANYSPVADRYLYAAAAPWALLLAAAVYGPRGRVVLAAFALFWGAASVRRTALFREPGRLYRQTAACAPRNPRAHALLAGWQFRAENRPDWAWENFERAFALDPRMISHFSDPGLTHRQPPAYVRGTLLLELGRPDQAAPLLFAAVREAFSPRAEGAARSRWGDALAALGRTHEAIGQQLKAHALLSNWAAPPLKLAALHMQSNPATALAWAKKALERSPSDAFRARSWSVIGDAQWRMKRPARAEDAWRRSLRLAPFQPATTAFLADLLEADGRFEEAQALRSRIKAFLPSE